MKRKEHKIINNVELKHCNKCNQWKELKNFNKSKKQWDGLRFYCKSCLKKKAIEYRKNNKHKAKKYRKTEEYKKATQKYRKSEKCKKTLKKYRKKLNQKPEAKIKIDIRQHTNNHLGSAKNYICMMCGKQAEEFHHFTYDKHFKINTVTLCIDCHRLIPKD